VKRTVPKEKKVKPEVGGPKKLTRKEMVERDKRIYGRITRFFGAGVAKDSKAAVSKGAEEGGTEPVLRIRKVGGSPERSQRINITRKVYEA
jgi:hypothetical protein